MVGTGHCMTVLCDVTAGVSLMFRCEALNGVLCQGEIRCRSPKNKVNEFDFFTFSVHVFND